MPYKDKAKQKEAQHKHYLKHKNDYKSRAAKRAIKIKLWLIEYKKTLKCEECGEDDHICLDFHHTNPDEKDMNVSALVYGSMNKQKIMNEISKCSVLCSNCHRKEHRKILLKENFEKYSYQL